MVYSYWKKIVAYQIFHVDLILYFNTDEKLLTFWHIY